MLRTEEESLRNPLGLLDAAERLGRVHELSRAMRAHVAAREARRSRSSSLEKLVDPRARVASLRKMGFRIAIDDLGAGYAGLTSVSQLAPEVVKLDMSLVRGISKAPIRQRVVASLIELCRSLGTHVVSEGVETVEERDCLVELGGDLFQGYLFGRRARGFPTAEHLEKP